MRAKGAHFEAVFLKLKARLGYAKAVWAVAHRLARVIWNVLHDGDRYLEHSEALNPKARARAIARHLRALTRLGYRLPDVLPDPLSAAPLASLRVDFRWSGCLRSARPRAIQMPLGGHLRVVGVDRAAGLDVADIAVAGGV